MSRPANHERRARVAELFGQGLTYAEISTALGVSRSAVANDIRALGLSIPRGGRPGDWRTKGACGGRGPGDDRATCRTCPAACSCAIGGPVTIAGWVELSASLADAIA